MATRKGQTRPRCQMMISRRRSDKGKGGNGSGNSGNSRDSVPRTACSQPIAVGNTYTCAQHTVWEQVFINPETCTWCASVIPPQNGVTSAYCSRKCRSLHTQIMAGQYPRGPRCTRCQRPDTWLYGYGLYTCAVCGYDSSLPDRTVPGRIAAPGQDLHELRALAVQSEWQQDFVAGKGHKDAAPASASASASAPAMEYCDCLMESICFCPEPAFAAYPDTVGGADFPEEYQDRPTGHSRQYAD